MTSPAFALLLCLVAVAHSSPTHQDVDEDLNQLMKRFMFDNYDYDYAVDNHHEDESPAEHQRHTTTVRTPSRQEQRRSQAQKQSQQREQQRKEQERKEHEEKELKEKELRARQAKEQEQKEMEQKEREQKAVPEEAQQKVAGETPSAPNASGTNPQLREFTLIISKLLFHLSQM